MPAPLVDLLAGGATAFATACFLAFQIYRHWK